ncbi:DUF2867 domain-containing protein [Vibrio navarrensis]|nr:DUF2867 domain-containing protein [Vibrio navarrensis]
MTQIHSVPLPSQSALFGRQQKRGFSDALRFQITDTNRTPSEVYVDVFGHLPKSVEKLMALRNALVKPFGFAISAGKVALNAQELREGEGIGLHHVESLSRDEIICTTEDKHMRVSLSIVKHAPGQFTLSTLVNTHTWIGYLYLLAIIPFHKVIALGSLRSMLNRVANAVHS